MKQKKPLAGGQEVVFTINSYLPAIAVGISTFPIGGLLQLQRADPSAAPDKVFKFVIGASIAISLWLSTMIGDYLIWKAVV